MNKKGSLFWVGLILVGSFALSAHSEDGIDAVYSLAVGSAAVENVLFSPDGRFLAFSKYVGGQGTQICLLDTEPPRVHRRVLHLSPATRAGASLGW